MRGVIIDAVYENGVLRPLAPVALDENAQFRVFAYPVGQDADIDDLIDHDAMEETRQEVAKMGRIRTIEETREMLRDMPGSLADAIIDERDDS